jgi:hypothetical protein
MVAPKKKVQSVGTAWMAPEKSSNQMFGVVGRVRNTDA